MTPLVAIIAPGAMGSAVARRLHDNGVPVLTVLEERSAETIARAKDAGMTVAGYPELTQAGIFLSIVPPGEAVALAEKIAAGVAASSGRPIYVDCNAINPATSARAAQVVNKAGFDYVDAGIIGGPPRRGYNGPVFYLSGDRARDVAILSDFGLNCRVLNSGNFAASALKMSYAGITKGLTAIASIMILGASHAGVADALRVELAESQPTLLDWFERQIPSMSPKAYRWVAEMEEIASFLHQQPEAETLFRAAAEFYARMAGEAGVPDVAALSDFFANEVSNSPRQRSGDRPSPSPSSR